VGLSVLNSRWSESAEAASPIELSHATSTAVTIPTTMLSALLDMEGAFPSTYTQFLNNKVAPASTESLVGCTNPFLWTIRTILCIHDSRKEASQTSRIRINLPRWSIACGHLPK
jgi:hypothetical protein